MYDALRSHFEAKRRRALVNLANYVDNSVGVGEHPDVVGEAIKLVEDVDHADSCLDTLKKYSSQLEM
jgi:hypothetical protein